MRSWTSACVVVVLSLAACADSKLDDEVVDELSSELRQPRTVAARHEVEIGDFVGAWQELGASPGYAAFMWIGASGQSYLCNEDGKSQASFEVTVESGHAVMGEYGYGAGDTLSLERPRALVRVGVDHGETYTIRYARTLLLPRWCRTQIREMRAE